MSAQMAAVQAAVTEPPVLVVDNNQPCPVSYVDGRWVKPRCSHQQCRDTLQTVRRFTDELHDPDLAAEWVAAGVTDRKHLKEWIRDDIGLSPTDAAPWAAEGLTAHDSWHARQMGMTPRQAHRWKTAVATISNAKWFIENGITDPDAAAPWHEAGLGGTFVPRVLAAGHDPQSYTRFMQASGIIPPSQWQRWIGVDYLHYQDPDLAGRWFRTGISTRDQTEWHETGWAPEDAAPWEHLGITPSDATEFTAAGVTAQDITELTAAVPSIRWTGATEGSRTRVQDYLHVIKTQGVDAARRWADIGCDSGAVVGAVNWGLRPEDVTEARRDGSTSVTVDGMTVTARWKNGRTRWTVTSPDGTDVDTERVAAAFTGTVPEWDRVRTVAQRFAKYTLTAGDALEAAAANPSVTMNDGFRKLMREAPLHRLRSRLRVQELTTDHLSRWTTSEPERRKQARRELGLSDLP